MPNENTEYEKLTKDIYETILKHEGIENVKLEHNVKIPGKSGCQHQIDVYWEFKIAGIKHRVAIECKNYNNKVSIAKVRDFFGVVYDIGNIKGIFVTKVGYQSGTIKFGKYYGIDLKEIRFPNNEDWNDRIKDIHINFTAYRKHIKDINIDFDYKWINEHTNYKVGDCIKYEFKGLNNECIIIDDKDNQLTNLYNLENSLPCNLKEEYNLEKIYNFDNAYIYDAKGIKIKINNIHFKYDVLCYTSKIISEGEKIAKAILKDVHSGQIKFFHK